MSRRLHLDIVEIDYAFRQIRYTKNGADRHSPRAGIRRTTDSERCCFAVFGENLGQMGYRFLHRAKASSQHLGTQAARGLLSGGNAVFLHFAPQS